MEPPFPIVVGRGRSGTSLLRAILTSHSDMAVPQESHFLVKLGRQRERYERPVGFDQETFTRDLCANWAFRRWGISEAEVHTALASTAPASYPEAVRIIYRHYARLQGKSRYGDKTPIYVLHVAFLAGLFPEAKLVHIIRDGRDVALSYMDARWGPDTVGEAAWYWKRAVQRGRRDGQLLGPERYMEVRYEDLIADPERTTRDVCVFIALGFEESMLHYFEQPDRILAGLPFVDEHLNLRLPPTKGLRDWRQQMPSRDVGVFEVIAGDLLSELGYERTTDRPSLQVRMQARAEWIGVHRERVDRVLRKRFVDGRKKHGPVATRPPRSVR